jgi:protein-S-isoprenylcysteine O-methyltransferase Ste14
MLTGFVIAVYLSLAAELIFLPVPSVASTYQLFYPRQDDMAERTLLNRVRALNPVLKTLILAAPTVIGLAFFCLPLVLVLFPDLSANLTFASFQGQVVILAIGVVMILLGRIITVATSIQLRHQNSQIGDEFGLKTTAVFARSRNPGLVGMYLCFAGLYLFYPTWIMIAGFVIYVANMHIRVLLEEDFLASMFGPAYISYKTRTRRYV